jgi:HK97 family phage major capsid protein
VLPELLKMQFNNSSIAPVWIPSAQEGAPSRLFGYPLVIREDAPILGSYGDVSLCCFDFYGLRDGLGIRVDASQHTGDNFTKGLTSIRIRASVDGKPLLSQPWMLADETTQVSPFVILDTPEGGSGS